LRSCRNTAPEQDGDPVALGRAERRCFADHPSDMLGEAFGFEILAGGD